MTRERPPALRGPGLRQQDLAALPVLRALLQERSVTRAGERVGLSQPATSTILARLRRRFGDELLVRVGREYELTPMAAGILARLDLAVEALDRIFADEFDPWTSTRTFTMMASDYTTLVIGEVLNSVLAEEAPAMRLDLRRLSSELVPGLESALRNVDGIVMPSEITYDFPFLPLLTDRWVCVVSADNDQVGERLTEDNLVTLPWVAAYQRSEPVMMPAMRQLSTYGIQPHVEVMVDSFVEVPFLVAGSPRLAFLHERLARRLEPVVPIRILDCPVPVDDLSLAMFWHPAADDDPGHRWFREALTTVATRIEGTPA